LTRETRIDHFAPVSESSAHDFPVVVRKYAIGVGVRPRTGQSRAEEGRERKGRAVSCGVPARTGWPCVWRCRGCRARIRWRRGYRWGSSLAADVHGGSGGTAPHL